MDRALDGCLARHPSASPEPARSEIDDRALKSNHLGGREHRTRPLLPADGDDVGANQVLRCQVVDRLHRHPCR